MKNSVNKFQGTILKANNGLKTKLDVSALKFKKTFLEAKKMGLDLNNTTQMFKKDGIVYVISVQAFKYKCDGRYRETVNVYPYLILR